MMSIMLIHHADPQDHDAISIANGDDSSTSDHASTYDDVRRTNTEDTERIPEPVQGIAMKFRAPE
jgi:hypothetical protein